MNGRDGNGGDGDGGDGLEDYGYGGGYQSYMGYYGGQDGGNGVVKVSYRDYV